MMKKYLLIMAGLLISSIFGVSMVWASIGLPPSDPQDNSPGIEISPEQRRHSDCVKACEKQYKQQVESCPNPGDPFGGNAYSNCVKTAQNTLQGCFRMCEELRNPPPIILPNDGTPGEPAQEPPCVEIPEEENRFNQAVQWCHDQYKRRLASGECERYPYSSQRPDTECLKRLQKWLQECYQGARQIIEPPRCPLLPDDDSSGEDRSGFHQ